MFDEEINDKNFHPVSEEELLGIMKSFKRDKCPGPDGWRIEFFVQFFDLFNADLLRMIEGSRMSGSINPKVASTNIALIPKKEKAESFMDFQWISLCNISYKIIAKVNSRENKRNIIQILNIRSARFS